MLKLLLIYCILGRHSVCETPYFKSSVVAEQDFRPELLRQESNTKVGAGVITGGRRTELTGVGQQETTSEVGPTRKGLYSSLPA